MTVWPRGGAARAVALDAVRACVAVAVCTLGALVAPPERLAVAQPAPSAASPHAEHGHGGGPHDATVRHSFAEVERWSKVFDDPSRDGWQKPNEVVQALELRPGMLVADLGAGTGYFSRYLSEAVGSRGAVLAVDVEPTLVEHLRTRAEREKLANLIPVLASADDARLPAGRVDLVLLVDTFHHLDDRITYLRQLRASLAPGGRVAIIDFQKRELPVGPDVAHKLAREQIVSEMESAGYRLAVAPDVLPYQYFLVFAPGG